MHHRTGAYRGGQHGFAACFHLAIYGNNGRIKKSVVRFGIGMDGVVFVTAIKLVKNNFAGVLCVWVGYGVNIRSSAIFSCYSSIPESTAIVRASNRQDIAMGLRHRASIGRNHSRRRLQDKQPGDTRSQQVAALGDGPDIKFFIQINRNWFCVGRRQKVRFATIGRVIDTGSNRTADRDRVTYECYGWRRSMNRIRCELM